MHPTYCAKLFECETLEAELLQSPIDLCMDAGALKILNEGLDSMTIRWKLFVFAISFLALSSIGLHAQSGITEQNGRSITCASDDGKRHLCPVPTQYGVRMTNQRSGSPCIQGQTWGYNNQGIWVDRGCRADFWLGGGYHHGGGGNGGYPGGGGGGGYYPGGGPTGNLFLG